MFDRDGTAMGLQDQELVSRARGWCYSASLAWPCTRPTYQTDATVALRSTQLLYLLDPSLPDRCQITLEHREAQAHRGTQDETI